MTTEFNKRIDKSVAYLEENFNYQTDDAPMTKPEIKEMLICMLELIKEDVDGTQT